MKHFLTLFVFVSLGFSTIAQNQKLENYIPKAPKPILIINNMLISNIDLLNRTSSEKILEVKIFKDKKLSDTNLFIENKNYKGIVTAKIKHQFKYKTQKELNLFFGLDEKNDIYINGYLIEDKSQNIVTESISGISIIQPQNLRINKPVLNIDIE